MLTLLWQQEHKDWRICVAPVRVGAAALAFDKGPAGWAWEMCEKRMSVPSDYREHPFSAIHDSHLDRLSMKAINNYLAFVALRECDDS